jgi:hypothetical protein
MTMFLLSTPIQVLRTELELVGAPRVESSWPFGRAGVSSDSLPSTITISGLLRNKKMFTSHQERSLGCNRSAV